jgi:hypothetical protein
MSKFVDPKVVLERCKADAALKKQMDACEHDVFAFLKKYRNKWVRVMKHDCEIIEGEVILPTPETLILKCSISEPYVRISLSAIADVELV